MAATRALVSRLAKCWFWAVILAAGVVTLTSHVVARPCDGDNLFNDPSCETVFREINRDGSGAPDEPSPKSARKHPINERHPFPIQQTPPTEQKSVTQAKAATRQTAEQNQTKEDKAPSGQDDASKTTRSPAPRGPDGLPPEPPPRDVPETRWKTVRYQDKGLTEAELIAAECTRPLSHWTVIDVHNTSDLSGIRATLKNEGNVLVRVHYPDNPQWNGVHEFNSLNVRGGGCVKVVGINDPTSGKRPTVRNIAASRMSGASGERPGGLIIENMRISMGDHFDVHGPSGAGNCILWPNAAQFVVIRNTVVSKCQHHAFITSRAYQQYLEIEGSHFEYAQSHLAYIDRVGFAYIHNSTFQSPGWGHALRCIAAKCVIDNVHVSNVELDGTIAPKGINPRRPKQHYVGLNPMDLYMVGGEHTLRNSRIDYYNPGNGGAWAAQYRARWGIFATDLGTHDGESWTYAPYWTQKWFEVQGKPVKPIDLTVSNNIFNCLNRPCYMFLVQSSYPRYASGKTRSAMRAWLKKHQWEDWDTMLANAPDEWAWTLSRAYDEFKPSLLRGETGGVLPARIPEEPAWAERGLLIIENNNTINNPKATLIRPEKPSSGYCWGFWVEGKEGRECQASVRQGRVVIEK